MGTPTNLTALQEIKETVAALKKNDFDAIFEQYQLSGTREDYGYAFTFNKFTDETFYPKYDIVPYGQYGDDGAYQMFHKFNYEREPFDLTQRLEECGVKIDTSRAINVQQMFYNSNISKVPAIDMTKCTGNRWTTQQPFSNAQYLKTVEKIIVAPETYFSIYSFASAWALENIIVEGTIAGGNGLDLRYSRNLTKDSIISFINALSTETAPYSVSFSLRSVNKAFETSDGANDGSTSAEWEALIATRPLWTIVLGEV